MKLWLSKKDKKIAELEKKLWLSERTAHRRSLLLQDAHEIINDLQRRLSSNSLELKARRAKIKDLEGNIDNMRNQPPADTSFSED